jgi:hypothetical protein
MNKKIITVSSIAKIFNKSSAEMIQDSLGITKEKLSYIKSNEKLEYEKLLKTMLLNELDLSVEELVDYANKRQNNDRNHKTICLLQKQQELIHEGIEYKVLIERVDNNFCQCGCGKKTINNLKYINNAHKNRAFRARRKEQK